MFVRLDMDRVEARLGALKRSATWASRMASPSASPDLLRDHKRNPDRGMQIQTARRLAEVLECDLASLLDGKAPQDETETASLAAIRLDDLELRTIAQMRADPKLRDAITALLSGPAEKTQTPD